MIVFSIKEILNPINLLFYLGRVSKHPAQNLAVVLCKRPMCFSGLTICMIILDILNSGHEFVYFVFIVSE